MSDLSPEMKKELSENVIAQQIQMLQMPWMTAFMGYDPAPYLKGVNCPILAVNGEKDFQVLSSLNLGAIEKALSGKKDVTIYEFKKLNQFFQTAETGAFDEYATIQETFAPVAEFKSNNEILLGSGEGQIKISAGTIETVGTSNNNLQL
mgnify:CR=1 FL=1